MFPLITQTLAHLERRHFCVAIPHSKDWICFCCTKWASPTSLGKSLWQASVDRGANSGIMGNDCRIITGTVKHLDPCGVDNHTVGNLELVTAGARVMTQNGLISIIMNQHARMANGKTMCSSGQMEHNKIAVIDWSLQSPRLCLSSSSLRDVKHRCVSSTASLTCGSVLALTKNGSLCHMCASHPMNPGSQECWIAPHLRSCAQTNPSVAANRRVHMQ
jgi:hypothetical protein